MSPAATTPVKDLTDAQLADAFAEVRLRWKGWQPNVNPHQALYSELSAELLARQADKPAAARILVDGERFIVPISPRENKRTIIKPIALYRRFKKLSEKRFLALYKITLGAIDKAISDPSERARYVKEERTGAREIQEPVLREARPEVRAAA